MGVDVEHAQIVVARSQRPHLRQRDRAVAAEDDRDPSPGQGKRHRRLDHRVG
jgi:hypothetical protein